MIQHQTGKFNLKSKEHKAKGRAKAGYTIRCLLIKYRIQNTSALIVVTSSALMAVINRHNGKKGPIPKN